MLEEISRQLDLLETAEGALEARVQSQLKDLEQRLHGLAQPVRAKPQWMLQKIRCSLMLGRLDEPLADIERLMRSNPSEIVLEECLRILKHLEDPQSQISRKAPHEALVDRVRFEQVMEQLPMLLQCQDLAQLQRRSCELTRRLLRCHEVHWLEADGLQFSTSQAPTPVSQSLLESARAAQVPVAGNPSTHESLQLSEVESALAIPLDGGVCLYALHKSLEQLWTPDDLSVASMLADVINLRHGLLGQRLAEEQQTRKLWEVRNRLQHVVDISEVGLVWLDEQQRALDWNQWANHWLTGLQVGQPPVLPTQDLPDVWKVRGPEGDSRWIEASRENDLLILRDASYQRLEDLLLVMEQDRHQAAADLHDGPLQVVAAQLQQNSSPELSRLWEEMHENLRWLRSPLLEGLNLEDALLFAVQAFFNDIPLEIRGGDSEAPLTQKLALYRCAFEVMEHLSEHGYPELLNLTLRREEQLLALEIGPIAPELPEPTLQCSAAMLSGGWLARASEHWVLQINWG